VTASGSDRAVFRRALDRGNLLVAEQVARDVGHVDLREALELCALIATHTRDRGTRPGTRWLCRWLEQAKALPPIDEVAMVAAALAALGGPGHHDALASLRAAAARAGCRGWETLGV
jgi:hypothetical protein